MFGTVVAVVAVVAALASPQVAAVLIANTSKEAMQNCKTIHQVTMQLSPCSCHHAVAKRLKETQRAKM